MLVRTISKYYWQMLLVKTISRNYIKLLNDIKMFVIMIH